MKGKKITAIAMGVGAVFMVAAGAASAAAIIDGTQASATVTLNINKPTPVSHNLKVNADLLTTATMQQNTELVTGTVKGDKGDVFAVQMGDMNVTDHPYCTYAVPVDSNDKPIENHVGERLELCFDEVTQNGKVDIKGAAWYKIASTSEGVGSYSLRTSKTILASNMTPGAYAVTVHAGKFAK
ncbi:hypothetical protein [Aeromonas sp. R9-2]|uniref:hypothetical protein n=1 Tax=Aeromonas sp. R9-2 TaxID=3138479 RepID=UPI0034A105EC